MATTATPTKTEMVTALIKALTDGRTGFTAWMPLSKIRTHLGYSGLSCSLDALREWMEHLVRVGKAETMTNNGTPMYRLKQQLPAPQRARDAIKQLGQGTFNIRAIRKESGMGLLETKKALDTLEGLKEIERVGCAFDYRIVPKPEPKPMPRPISGNPLYDYFGDGRLFTEMDAAIAANAHPRQVKRALSLAVRQGLIRRVTHGPDTGKFRVTQINPDLQVRDFDAARLRYFKAQGGANPDATVSEALIAALNDVQFAGLLTAGVTETEDALALLDGIKRACDEMIAQLSARDQVAA